MACDNNARHCCHMHIQSAVFYYSTRGAHNIALSCSTQIVKRCGEYCDDLGCYMIREVAMPPPLINPQAACFSTLHQQLLVAFIVCHSFWLLFSRSGQGGCHVAASCLDECMTACLPISMPGQLRDHHAGNQVKSGWGSRAP